MSNKMWGGRFDSGPDAIMEDINASIEFDKALWRQDIAGSRAHVDMLAKQGIIEAKDAATISKGLENIATEIESGQFTFSRALEDIHMNIESRLAETIGAAAGRLHTARSRNDQVATDMRLWVRDTLDLLDGQAAALQSALAEKALAFAGAVMPGFTHLQSAQPQFARQRLGSRLRARSTCRRLHLSHASVPLRRGDRHLDDAAIRPRRFVR